MKRLALVVIALSTAPLLMACGHGPERHGKKLSAQRINHKLDILADYLDANERQRKVIRQKAAEVGTRAMALRNDHEKVKQTALAEWSKERPDTRVMHELVDRKIKQVQTLAHQMVDALADVHRELTPEQRAKLAKLIREH